MAELQPASIAVRRTDAEDERLLLIPLEHVAYFLVVSPAGRNSAGMPKPLHALPPNTVYVRSIHGGSILRTCFPRLKPLRRQLDPVRFLSISRTVIVSVRRLVEIDLGRRVIRVGVKVGPGVESFLVSRRAFRRLRALIGIPSRISRPARSAASRS